MNKSFDFFFYALRNGIVNVRHGDQNKDAVTRFRKWTQKFPLSFCDLIVQEQCVALDENLHPDIQGRSFSRIYEYSRWATYLALTLASYGQAMRCEIISFILIGFNNCKFSRASYYRTTEWTCSNVIWSRQIRLQVIKWTYLVWSFLIASFGWRQIEQRQMTLQPQSSGIKTAECGGISVRTARQPLIIVGMHT